MIYNWLADATLLLHLAFIVFVVLGGLLVAHRPRLAWLHIPAVLWGAVVEFTGGVCPLTPLEVELRELGGDASYSGGFIEHYVAGLIYPGGLSRRVQVILGVLALGINVAVYAVVFSRKRAARP